MEKSRTLANWPMKRKPSDSEVLAAMGLAEAVVESRAGSAPPTPVAAAVKRSRQYVLMPEAFAARRRQIQADPHLMRRAHLLRLMEPGKTYVLRDLARACTQLGYNSVSAHMRQRLLLLGFVERVPAPPGMTAGPLRHGSPRKDPLRWLYRLTEAGEAVRAEILRRDAEAGQATEEAGRSPG